jgi:hypothetical protein
MGIPGAIPRYEARAKVRCGIKVGGQPRSVDYFVCDGDTEFNHLYPGQPKVLRVWLPYADPEECFSTGLEWWRGKQLACYTKGEGNPPFAFRITDLVDADDVVRSSRSFGQGRTAITCRYKSCPHFGPRAQNKQCRTLGRLFFWLDGGTQDDTCYELDTKGQYSIERLVAFLARAAVRGDLRGRPFELYVQFESTGNKRFPVVRLREVDDGEEEGKGESARTEVQGDAGGRGRW